MFEGIREEYSLIEKFQMTSNLKNVEMYFNLKDKREAGITLLAQLAQEDIFLGKVHKFSLVFDEIDEIAPLVTTIIQKSIHLFELQLDGNKDCSFSTENIKRIFSALHNKNSLRSLTFRLNCNTLNKKETALIMEEISYLTQLELLELNLSKDLGIVKQLMRIGTLVLLQASKMLSRLICLKNLTLILDFGEDLPREAVRKFFATFKHLIYLEKVQLSFGSYLCDEICIKPEMWDLYLSYLPKLNKESI